MDDDRSCPEDVDDYNDSIKKKRRIGSRRYELNIDMHSEKLSYLCAQFKDISPTHT
jgi:hypothetical protein